MIYSTNISLQSQSNSNNNNQVSTTSTSTATAPGTTVYTTSMYSTSTSVSPFSFNFGNQDIPLGTANLDLDLVVEHEQTVKNGPTILTGEEGKTIYYDINVNSFPLKEIIEFLYPDQANFIDYVGIKDSKIFFKVIDEENGYLQVIPGFILGDNIIFDTSVFFNTNTQEIPDFLNSFFIPKLLTLLYPYDGILMKNINSTQSNPKCYNNFIYDYNFACPSVAPPFMNYYLDNSNFEDNRLEMNKYYSKLFDYSNVSIYSNHDWNSADESFINDYNVSRVVDYSFCYNQSISGYYCYSSYYYYQEADVFNNQVNISIPYDYVFGVYRKDGFNFLKRPLTDQQASNYLSYGYYDYENKRTTVNLQNGLSNGTKTIVVFRPSNNIYAIDGKIDLMFNTSLNNIKIKNVLGIFSQKEFDRSKSITEQTGINYFTGGSFSDHSITLGTNPGSKSLIVIYQNQTHPNLYYKNTINSTNFQTEIKIDMNAPFLTEAGYSVNWELNSDGWFDKMHIWVNVDTNKDGIFSTNENFDISIDYNSEKSLRTNNPLSVGDKGEYKIKNSFLNLKLSPEYNYLFEQATKDTTKNFSDSVNNLNGKKLLDYTITSTDGLLNFFDANVYNPFSNSGEPNYQSKFLPENGFSSFDGILYKNKTVSKTAIEYLFPYFSYNMNELTNYYKSNFGSEGNFTFYNDYVIENITLSNGYGKLGLATEYYYDVTYYLASEYDFSKGPFDQTINANVVSLYPNTTDNSLSFIKNSYDNISLDSNVIVVYQPSSFLYAINGRIVLPDNPVSISAIYLVGAYGYVDYNKNYLDSSSINGKEITLDQSAPKGIYRVSVEANFYSWNGNKVYMKNPTSLTSLSFIIFPNIFSPLTPARTTDFFLTENNINAYDTILQDKLQPVLTYVESFLNTQLKDQLFSNLSLAGNLSLAYNSNEENDKTSLLNSSLLLNLPLKNFGVNSPLKIDLTFNLIGNLDLWTTWSETGILKEFGIHLHASLKTSPRYADISSTTTSFTKSSTVITSDGFVFPSLIILIFAVLPVLVNRRKKKD
jgi:hypothetical protein